jgi:hypothetical protein
MESPHLVDAICKSIRLRLRLGQHYRLRLGQHRVVFDLGDGLERDDLAVGVSNQLVIRFAEDLRHELVAKLRVHQCFD